MTRTSLTSALPFDDTPWAAGPHAAGGPCPRHAGRNRAMSAQPDDDWDEDEEDEDEDDDEEDDDDEDEEEPEWYV